MDNKEPKVIINKKNKALLDDISDRYHLTSYLSKLIAASTNIFKSEFAPPSSIAKSFMPKFKIWLDEQILLATGKNDSIAGAFTENEVLILKKMIQNYSAGLTSRVANSPTMVKSVKSAIPVTPGMPIQRSRAVMGPPQSTDMVVTPAKPTNGSLMYIIDSSIFTDPDISSGSEVVVMSVANNRAMVRLNGKPSNQFFVDLDNLSSNKGGM